MFNELIGWLVSWSYDGDNDRSIVFDWLIDWLVQLIRWIAKYPAETIQIDWLIIDWSIIHPDGVYRQKDTKLIHGMIDGSIDRLIALVQYAGCLRPDYWLIHCLIDWSIGFEHKLSTNRRGDTVIAVASMV